VARIERSETRPRWVYRLENAASRSTGQISTLAAGQATEGFLSAVADFIEVFQQFAANIAKPPEQLSRKGEE
jgi:ATP-dependent protease HslVU (ClpYQ) peptidase subunit